jgi:hypothetical protein
MDRMKVRVNGLDEDSSRFSDFLGRDGLRAPGILGIKAVECASHRDYMDLAIGRKHVPGRTLEMLPMLQGAY